MLEAARAQLAEGGRVRLVDALDARARVAVTQLAAEATADERQAMRRCLAGVSRTLVVLSVEVDITEFTCKNTNSR